MSFLDEFEVMVDKVHEAEDGEKGITLDLYVKIQQTRAICSIADSLMIIGQAYDLPRDIPNEFPDAFKRGDEE